MSKIDLNNLSFTDLMVVNTDKAPAPKLSLQDRVTQEARLLFLFDISSSMLTRLAHSWEDAFIFPPAMLADFRRRIADLKAQCDNGTLPYFSPWGDTAIDYAHVQAMAATCDPSRTDHFNIDDDNGVKAAIIRNDVLKELYNPPPVPGVGDVEPPTRIDVVKRLAKEEIRKRMLRNSKNDIGVIAFNEHPQFIIETAAGVTYDDVEAAINDRLHACGGTDIPAAVKRGMDVCRDRPSTVGVHHFVIVSDGEDAVDHMLNWIPTLKASGVVIDYIHIGDLNPNNDLKTICAATGGEYVLVTTERDLTQRFIAAVTRLLAPPA